MKFLRNVAALSFTVVGSVIGAGFISGREIISFFYGQNVFAVAVILFLSFSLGLAFMTISEKIRSGALFAVVAPVILVFDFVIMSGMLASLDSLQYELFGLDGKYPVLSGICLLLSNVILISGVKGVFKVNLLLVPIMIAVTVILTLSGGGGAYTPTNTVKPAKIFSYVGLNLFTSSFLLIDGGRRLNKAERILAAVLSSVVISLLVYLISSALFCSGREIIYSDLPLLKFAGGEGILYHLFEICMAFGIFTTLLSSHYPLFSFIENKRLSVVMRVLVSVLALVASRLGFYNIVSYVYPFIGAFGGAAIVAISISALFFPSKKRVRTSIPPGDTE